MIRVYPSLRHKFPCHWHVKKNVHKWYMACKEVPYSVSVFATLLRIDTWTLLHTLLRSDTRTLLNTDTYFTHDFELSVSGCHEQEDNGSRTISHKRAYTRSEKGEGQRIKKLFRSEKGNHINNTSLGFPSGNCFTLLCPNPTKAFSSRTCVGFVIIGTLIWKGIHEYKLFSLLTAEVLWETILDNRSDHTVWHLVSTRNVWLIVCNYWWFWFWRH